MNDLDALMSDGNQEEISEAIDVMLSPEADKDSETGSKQGVDPFDLKSSAKTSSKCSVSKSSLQLSAGSMLVGGSSAVAPSSKMEAGTESRLSLDDVEDYL
jgi:hypothetical protein